jgi:phage shock protein E
MFNGKRIVFIAGFMLLISMLTGCKEKVTNRETGYGVKNEVSVDKIRKNNETTFEKITPKEAKRRLIEDDSIVLLDVRTEFEYSQESIPGSILIPLDRLSQEVEERIADKENPVFVYCRSGNRSLTASKTLVKLGYKEVYDLGGIIDWPYEIE